VFRGSSVARVDEKGRIKIPTQFRQPIESQFGNEFYITSIDGSFARIYPLPVWVDVEKWLLNQPEFDPDVMHFQEALTYYGSTASMDKQGRILIHADLREKAGIVDEVKILGQLKYLDVWNLKKLDERIGSYEINDEKLKALSDRARRES
jgi:MraZ protein